MIGCIEFLAQKHWTIMKYLKMCLCNFKIDYLRRSNEESIDGRKYIKLAHCQWSEPSAISVFWCNKNYHLIHKIHNSLISFWSHNIQSDDKKFVILRCYMERAEDYVMRDIRCINIGLIFEKPHRQLTLREVTCDWNSLYSTIIQLYKKDLLYLFSTLDFMRHLSLLFIK